MSDEVADEGEATDLPSPTEQWAFIFNTLGKKRLRDFLFHVATTFAHDDSDGGRDKLVYELQHADTGLTAMNVTDHVEALEQDVTPDQPADFPHDL